MSLRKILSSVVILSSLVFLLFPHASNCCSIHIMACVSRRLSMCVPCLQFVVTPKRCACVSPIMSLRLELGIPDSRCLVLLLCKDVMVLAVLLLSLSHLENICASCVLLTTFNM
jgi:hypothetical protein